MSEPIVRGVVVDSPTALRGGDPERPVRITVADAAYADLTPHEARTVAAALESEAATAGPTVDASAPTDPGEGHRTGTGGPDAPGASEGLDAAIEAATRVVIAGMLPAEAAQAAVRAAYPLIRQAITAQRPPTDLNAIEAAARALYGNDSLWPHLGAGQRTEPLRQARLAYEAMEPLIRQAVVEEIARALEARAAPKVNPRYQETWLLRPERAAEIAREVGRG